MSVKYVSVCAVPAPSSAISGGNTSRIIQIERRHVKTTVLAYANDVTVFVTDPSTFPTIRRATSTYELANGARLNPQNDVRCHLVYWKLINRTKD